MRRTNEMKLIFIHGLGQTGESWVETSKYIRKDMEVFSPNIFDLLGKNEANYENVYHAFCNYCNTFQEPIHICGLSLGGILALQYAIQHEHKVASIILIGTQYKMPKRLLKLQRIIFYIMPNKFFRPIGCSKQQFINLYNSVMRLDFSNSISRLSSNTLILCGEKDTFNKKASLDLTKKLPNATFQWIEKAGHEVNIDNPEKLGTIINEFLCKIK